MTDWGLDQKSIAKDIEEEGFAIDIIVTSIKHNPFKNKNIESEQVFGSYALLSSFKSSQVDEQFIKKHDRIFIVPGWGIPDLTTIDLANLKLRFDDKTFDIIKRNPAMPGGVVLLYKLHCR